MLQLLGERVLVEQLMVKKKSLIIQKNNAANEDKFDVTFRVIQISEDCPKSILKVGDKPVFSKYVDFTGIKVIEKEEDREVLHVVVSFHDIIAIDNDEEPAANEPVLKM